MSLISANQRTIEELLHAHRIHLLENVSRVQILGESRERDLKEVFVELNIVDRGAAPQPLGFPGAMESELRWRFNPFDNEYSYRLFESLGPDGETTGRLRPRELLRRRTKAIIIGAPGSGKTTLLKYLALQAAEMENRFVVWLELKAINRSQFAEAEKSAARLGSFILQELWLGRLKPRMTLSVRETGLLREYWQERFKANEMVVLLDGFDEVQDEVMERSLNKSVRDFACASHNNMLLISTRPFALHKLGKERLQEFQIQPLSQRQITAFLNCYYPNDSATKRLLKTLRERSSLRELLDVPLLLGIILRLHREDRFTDERLKLYEAIITDLVHELDRHKSVVRHFKISNERLRFDFLKYLAFGRLLADELEHSEHESGRIVFSYDVVREKAGEFLAQEGLPDNPRDLADDALATPLLREVGVDTFAFTHLTLQEYLAARAFAEVYKSDHVEGLRIFCRGYHHPVIVEMEVLPMILGLAAQVDDLYIEIEGWPDSLAFANLRLRARGLAYSAKINEEKASALVNRLLEFVCTKSPHEIPYRRIVINSFAGINRQALSLLNRQALSLMRSKSPDSGAVVSALLDLESEEALDVFILALKHEDKDLRWSVAIKLGEIGSDQAVAALISALSENDRQVGWAVIEALGEAGSDKAIDVLVSTLNDKDTNIQSNSISALEKIGSEMAVGALTVALSHVDGEVRRSACDALGRIGSEKALLALRRALTHEDSGVRWGAASSLGLLYSEKAVAALISAIHHDDSHVRMRVANILERVGSVAAIEALVSAAKDDEDIDVRMTAVSSLRGIGSDDAVEAIISALNDEDSNVRLKAVHALWGLSSKRVINALVAALEHEDGIIRSTAAYLLGELGAAEAAPVLNAILNDENSAARWDVAEALAKIDPKLAAENLVKVLTSESDIYLKVMAASILFEQGFGDAQEILIYALELNDEDSSLRGQAALALGRSGSPESVRALISALDDRDDYVKKAAARSLGMIGSGETISALLLALNYGDRRSSIAARTLSEMNGTALMLGLKQTMRHPSTFAQLRAVNLIGYYAEDDRILEQLRRLAQTEDQREIREGAKEAADKLARKFALLGHRAVTASATLPLRDNESRELFLVGEAFKIVAEAGHIFRPLANSDWGIDAEIEFKNQRGEASGERVYLQLKSGDTYLRFRKRDGKEIFRVKARHARYWQWHAYPVLLVIRNSDGRIRWMNVTEYLRRQRGSTRVIEFQGEDFNAGSVRQMRTRFRRLPSKARSSVS